MAKFTVTATLSDPKKKIASVYLYVYRRGRRKKQNLRIVRRLPMAPQAGAWVTDVDAPADSAAHKTILRVVAYDAPNGNGNTVAAVARPNREHT